ncbi:MAG TPA: ribosome recycling factor [Firmicutes bacterium]|jgi:ribosome recycling factor|nr:ribosome recycling factor [Bacillota bacterium]
MVDDLLKDASDKMEKSIVALQKDLATLRAGRATPALLDKIMVDYYGVPTPIVQMASVSVPEPRTLVIQPWDKGTVKDIEKAILKSDLGMTPISDGSVIRLPIPAMTEERRLELVKTVRKKGEDCKIAIRNIRREANDLLKDLEKASEISEDDLKRNQDDVQKMTDKQVKQIEEIIEAKEKEILAV